MPHGEIPASKPQIFLVFFAFSTRYAPPKPPHIPSFSLPLAFSRLPLSLSPWWHFQRGSECLNFAHQPHYGASKPSIDFKGRSFEFLITRMYGCCAQQLSDARHMRTRLRTGTGGSNAHILSSPLLQLFQSALPLEVSSSNFRAGKKERRGKKNPHPPSKKKEKEKNLANGDELEFGAISPGTCGLCLHFEHGSTACGRQSA